MVSPTRKMRPQRKQRVEVRKKLREAQGGLCCYCERPMQVWGKPTQKGGMPKDAETMEHLRRCSEGGTNANDNLALACHECNAGRGDLDWLTYKSIKTGGLL